MKSTEKSVDQAVESFSKHGIIARGDRWWMIGDGKSSVFQTTVFANPRGEITVQGDTDLCSFAFGPKNARGAVNWIGRQRFDGYVCEKASIGTTCHEMVWKFDSDALRESIEYWISEYESDAAEGEASPSRLAALNRALEDIDREEPLTILNELIDENVIEWEDMHSAEIPTTRVIYAWAAIQRLNELLNAEDSST